MSGNCFEFQDSMSPQLLGCSIQFERKKKVHTELVDINSVPLS